MTGWRKQSWNLERVPTVVIPSVLIFGLSGPWDMRKKGFLGRSLMIGWRKKILKPWKGALSIHFRVCLSVCLCVCGRATGHTFWPRNLIFGLSDPWDMRKKRIFLFFKIFIFTLFIGIFRFFPYITLVNFWFQASGHSFSPRVVIFGLSEHCTIENWRLLKKIENSIFFG